MKPEEKWNNTVIEVLDKEHGKKVIKWWKEQGVDTRDLLGRETKEKNSTYRYYGFLGGEFHTHNLSEAKTYNAKIITLPEPFPEKWYMICDEENQKVANEWRRKKENLSYKDSTVCIGYYFLSKCPYDESFFSGGEVRSDSRYKDYQEITFEQFKEHVLKQSNKMKITSEQAQEIIDMVSPSCSWKERLLDLWAKNIVLKQEIEVDDTLYGEGYKDALESQKKVLEEIFGKSKGIEVPNLNGRGFLCKKGSGEYRNISFYLSSNYNWEIKKDSDDMLCLIPTNK